jgi:hypothetical protein
LYVPGAGSASIFALFWTGAGDSATAKLQDIPQVAKTRALTPKKLFSFCKTDLPAFLLTITPASD